MIFLLFPTNNIRFELSTLDILLLDERTTVFGDDVVFKEFDIVHAKGIPQQSNATVCGLYTLKYIEALAQRRSTCDKVSIWCLTTFFFLVNINLLISCWF